MLRTILLASAFALASAQAQAAETADLKLAKDMVKACQSTLGDVWTGADGDKVIRVMINAVSNSLIKGLAISFEVNKQLKAQI